MQRPFAIFLGGVVGALLAAAGIGAPASSAARTAGSTGSATIDKTYSCRVRRQHFILISSTVTLPPVQNQPQPGVLDLTTSGRTIQKNGTTETVAQLGLSAKKRTFEVDKESCSPVKQKIPLNHKRLPGPPDTVTPTFKGHLNQRCEKTAAQLLVRIRFTATAGNPPHAVLAIRNDDAKRKPIAFYTWSPKKITAWTNYQCVDLG